MRGNRINISNLRSAYNKKFRLYTTEFDMKFNPETFEHIESRAFTVSDTDIFDTYHKCFSELLNYLKNVLLTHPEDFVGIKFRLISPTNDGNTFGLNYQQLRQINPTIITDLLQKVQQSNADFKSTEHLEITISVVERSEFVGARILLSKLDMTDYNKLCEKKKKSILIPTNEDLYDDDKCLARSLVIASEWEKSGHSRKAMRKLLNKSNSTLLKKKTDNLIKKAFGSYANEKIREKFTLADLIQFNKVLKNYQISVFDDIHLHKKVLYRSSRKCDKKINIFYLSGIQHCIAIANVKAFFGVEYICKHCDSPQMNKKHKCDSICTSCYTSPKCVDRQKNRNLILKFNCESCNRFFKSKKCYDNHKKYKPNEKYTVCEQYRVCNQCFIFYDRDQLEKLSRKSGILKSHVCNERYFFYCSRFVMGANHYCNIKVYTQKKTKKFMLCFYDIETVQKKPVEKTKKKRVLKTLDEQREVLDNLIKTGNEEEYNDARRSFYKYEEETQTEFIHEPLLLVCELVCYECYEWSDYEEKNCIHCGKGRYIFEGKDCLSQFLNLILKHRSDISKLCCIAHNSRSYDGQLICQELLKIPNNELSLIQSGFKILKLTVKNYISFIDSLSFIPVALDKFPSTFGLRDGLAKENYYCPFFFMSFSNWHHVGDLPAIDQFGIDVKDKENKKTKKFLDWYDNQPKHNYNLRENTIKYCINDVKILKMGCIKFMSSILKLADINPFLQCITLPHLSLTIFRKQYMRQNFFGIIPENEYHSNLPQSKKCRQWLLYLNYIKSKETTEKYYIKAEVKLPVTGRFTVDGYSENWPFETDKSKKYRAHIWEFLGCFWHSCKVCFDSNSSKLENKIETDVNLVNANLKRHQRGEGINEKLYSRGVLMQQNYHKTMARIRYFEKCGFRVHLIWEHEWDKFISKNKELADQINALDDNEFSVLSPRSALYGGRVESSVVHHLCVGKERVFYYDYCSLYPDAMKNGKQFKTHPKKILMQKECENITINDIMNMDGLAYVSVVCPRNLFWPIIPTRHEQKMYFVCCYSCLIEKNTERCTHNMIQRAIKGVYSTCELKLAFEHGYLLLKTYELWFYDTESGFDEGIVSPEDKNITYDELRKRLIVQEEKEAEIEAAIKEEKDIYKAVAIRQKELTKTKGGFTTFLNFFIRKKSSASGFPFGCITQKQKEQYIVDFFLENNIILKMEEIEDNPTMRSISKNIMNSLYGKLIMKNKTNQSVLKEPRDLHFFLNSDIHEVTDIYCPNDNYAIVSWKYKEDLEMGQPSNVSPIHPSKNSKRHVCLTSGIQTTAYGRIKWYSLASGLQKNLLYGDTDSAIFIQRNENDYVPPLSKKIGGLSDELSKYKKHLNFDPYIVEIVVIAPKSYGLIIVNDPDPNSEKIIDIKCKGFTISSQSSDQINFESMKSLVYGENYKIKDKEMVYLDQIVTRQSKIVVEKNHTVKTSSVTKTMKLTYDKRKVLPDLTAVPWGYEESEK